MIEVQELVKDYGRNRAVDGVSFAVDKGTVLGVLGPNGAGKSTIMRILAGYLAPTSGRALIQNLDTVSRPEEAQRLIGYMPENTPLYDDMTVEEFLRFIAEMRGFGGRARDERAAREIARCLLEPVRRQSIDTLSKGYRQRTCFAQALLHDPPILLLDEPTEGLDPNQKQVVRDMIRDMARERVILLSTHVLEEVEAICSRIVIISAGKLVADSTPAQLKRRSRHFNEVTLTLRAPAEEAVKAFRSLPAAGRVTALDRDGDPATLRLTPRDGQALAGEVLDLAGSKGWAVTDMRVDEGRLDDVFRAITMSDDLAVNRRKGA